MRRSTILLTAVIAVLAGALALSLSQNSNVANLFQTRSSDQETVGNTTVLNTADAQGGLTEAEAQTDTAIVADTTQTETQDVAAAADVTPPTNSQSDVATSTPVNLDATDSDLNAQVTAAGDDVATKTAEAPVEEKATEDKAAETETKFVVDVKKALEDREIGSANAPVTVEDFSSLTCPHCAQFHNEIFPKIKENYIDTGKVRWIFRGFPLNESALKAEMVSRCAPGDQYTKLQDMMYRDQQRWAFQDDPIATLAMMLRIAGINQDMFLACVNNKELEQGLATKIQAATEKYNINSTPTFIFNSGAKKFSGAGSYTGFAFDLDNLLGENKDDGTVPPPPAAQSTSSKLSE